MNKKGLLFSTLALLAIGSCKSSGSHEDAEQNSRTSFFDVTGMDSAVKPGDNFFEYANGKWIKTNKIPDDQSGWGSFYTLYEENQKKLKSLIEEAAKKDASKGTIEQKVGDYYFSGMDTLTIEKKGYEPLKPMLQKIEGAKDYKALVSIIAEGYKTGEGDLFGFFIGPDEKNSTKNIAVLYQTGLTLPEKDYYTKNDATTIEQRKQMEKYATRLFMLTGTDSVTCIKKSRQMC